MTLKYFDRLEDPPQAHYRCSSRDCAVVFVSLPCGCGVRGRPVFDSCALNVVFFSWFFCFPCAGRATVGVFHRQRRWFVLNPSTSMLLIYTHEVDLTVKEAESTRRSSGSIPKAYPLDCARVSVVTVEAFSSVCRSYHPVYMICCAGSM